MLMREKNVPILMDRSLLVRIVSHRRFPSKLNEFICTKVKDSNLINILMWSNATRNYLKLRNFEKRSTFQIQNSQSLLYELILSSNVKSFRDHG